MKITSNLACFSLLFSEYPDTRSDIDVYHVGLSKFLIGSLFADNFTSDIDVSHVGWLQLLIGAFIQADFSVLQEILGLSHSTKQFRFEFRRATTFSRISGKQQVNVKFFSENFFLD